VEFTHLSDSLVEYFYSGLPIPSTTPGSDPIVTFIFSPLRDWVKQPTLHPQLGKIFNAHIYFANQRAWPFHYENAFLLDSSDWDRISHLADLGYLLPTPDELARNASVWRRAERTPHSNES
jgi:hypothetical protein